MSKGLGKLIHIYSVRSGKLVAVELSRSDLRPDSVREDRGTKQRRISSRDERGKFGHYATTGIQLFESTAFLFTGRDKN